MPDQIDTKNQTRIICPYCGHESGHEDFGYADEGNYQCDECKGWFHMETETVLCFTTIRTCGPEGHDWKYTPQPYDYVTISCRKCGRYRGAWKKDLNKLIREEAS